MIIKKKSFLRKAMYSIISIIIALYTSDQIIYKYLILPNLTKLHSVPIAWWFITILPVIFVCIFISFISDSIKQLIAFAFITSVGTLLFFNILAFIGTPGHYKSLATEDPMLFWSLILLFVFMLYFTVQILGWFFIKRII